MASSTSARGPNSDSSACRAFRPRSAIPGSERRSRCTSPNRVSRRINPEAGLDEVQERLSAAAGRTESPHSSTKPGPLRLGQVSATAAALLAKDPHAPESLGVEITAGHSIPGDTGVPRLREGGSPLRQFSPLAHDSAPPLRARRPSRAWAGGLLTIVLPPFFVLVLEMPISSFWERQVGDHTFQLASSTSRPMQDPPAQRTAAPRLLAQGSQGMTGEPVLLGLKLLGRADGGVVLIAGLVPGMSLSSGRAVGADAWELPTADSRQHLDRTPGEFCRQGEAHRRAAPCRRDHRSSAIDRR